MKFLILCTLLLLFVFAGCSSKEFSDGAKDISNDVSRIFEPTK